MYRKILSIGVVGVVAAALAAVVAAPAQAAVTPDRGRSVQAIAPPAPAWAASASVSLASPPSPTISPATNVVWTPPGGTYSCGVGNLCVIVWDPNYLFVFGNGTAQLGGWAVFYLYVCREYELSNWNGDGLYLDNQTPAGLRGVKSYFRNQFHNTVGSPITPDGVQHWPYNWTPIWFIKNC